MSHSCDASLYTDRPWREEDFVIKSVKLCNVVRSLVPKWRGSMFDSAACVSYLEDQISCENHEKNTKNGILISTL